MAINIEQLKDGYYVSAMIIPFYDAPDQRTYSLTPKYEDNGTRKASTEIDLTEYMDYTRGRFFLTWTTDWNHQQFLEWVNRFTASRDTSGRQTRFDREVEHHDWAIRLTNYTIKERALATAINTPDLHDELESVQYVLRQLSNDHTAGFLGYRLIVEEARNGVRAYTAFDDEVYRRESIELAKAPQKGEVLNVPQLEIALEVAQADKDTKKRLEEVGLWVGLDACSFSYHPRGYDVHDPKSFLGERATITMGDFGADMLDEVTFGFVQTDVPETERFYFLEVLKQAIGHRAAESAKILNLEDLRYPRLRVYRKPQFGLYGWDPDRSYPKLVDCFQMDPENDVCLIAEVIKTPTGPVIALDLDRIALEGQDFDSLKVEYQAEGPKGKYSSWETKRLSLDQIRELLEQENKYRNYGKFRLFISDGAIKGDYMNVLKANGGIPETIAGWEDIVMRFSRSRTFLGSNHESQEGELKIMKDKVPSMDITFSKKLESQKEKVKTTKNKST